MGPIIPAGYAGPGSAERGRPSRRTIATRTRQVRSDTRQTRPEDLAVLDLMDTTITEQARLFRALHNAQHPLALSNVWDVASAAITAATGAPAIATTSAGIAWSLGLQDGDQLDRARVACVVAGIAAAVTVPVTADIEGGYAHSPEGVARTVAALLEEGAVGINIEDGDRSPETLVTRITAARHAADEVGMPLFINARTDVFLTGVGTLEQQVAEALTRASRYVDAGADGVFVPGVMDADSISALTARIPVPVNLMVGPGSLSVDELGRLGVARVSLGSGVAQAAYAVARRAAEELAATGTYDTLTDALDYGSLNGLLRRVVPVMQGGTATGRRSGAEDDRPVHIRPQARSMACDRGADHGRSILPALRERNGRG